MNASPGISAPIGSPVTDESSRWCIVGGGFLGMTLACRLAQNGHRVRLVEAEPELGGLASAWQLGPVVWDRHYHVILLSDARTRGLLRELGLEHELQWVETKTGFYANDQLHSLSNSIEYLRLPTLGWLDKLRLAATIVYGSRVRDWKRLESIPVREWLTRWSGKHTFDKLWLPLLRAKLGDNYQYASAAFIWATIARLYAARRTGLKKEMFGYLPGGYQRTIASLASRLDELGVLVQCRQPVTRIRRIADELYVEYPQGHTERFDNVVVTTPGRVASRICEGLKPQEQSALNGIRYMGIICASVLLKKPLANYYLTYLTDSWVPFTAVVEMSAMVDRRQFADHSLVYLPKYVDPQDPLFDADDAEIESSFLAALSRIYPEFRRSDVAAFRVSRVRNVFAIPTLGYSDNVPQLRTSVPGLYIANSSQIINGTLNINETVQLAERTATQLRQTTAGQSVHG